MSETTKTAEAAANEATVRLREMDSELAGLPELIRQAEHRARSSKTEEELEQHLAEKERLEKRKKTLPYLIPQQRIAVLRARALVEGERHERIRADLPPAIAERDAAKIALEEAEKRFKDAEETVRKLGASASGAHFNLQMLTQDADNIAAGRETTRYFTRSGSGL